MTTDSDKEGRGQGHSFTHTKKFSVSKLNSYKTFAPAVTYLKILSAAQKLHRTKRQYVKYNLRFYFCFCF